jgi:hypothetical protein
VSEKRNKIVEEQRRAREEFLKLKRMQQSGVQPEKKEEVKLPQTFGEKLQNFWYHYKVHTLLTVFIAVVIAITTVQCANREEYDMSVLYFAFEPTAEGQIELAEEYFADLATDVNGDGEVKVKIMNCSFNSELRDMQYKHTMLSKVQSVVAVERSVTLYVVDEKAVEYFDNAFDESIFEGELIPLSEDFYKETTIEKVTFPENLKIGLRRISGTAFEGKKEAEESYKEAQKIFAKIKKQNG